MYMKEVLLGIVYLVILIFMWYMSAHEVSSLVLRCINCFLIGHVCMLAYLKVIEY